VYALEHAAAHGDALWVALNSDLSAKKLKGPSRPIFSEINRAYILSSFECVAGIFIFDGERLALEISFFKPDVYVKSGDYNITNLDRAELEALHAVNAEIKFVPLVEGLSTTGVLASIKGY
jgi:glycerol-3-phosphate cytidylyltransferase